MSRDESLKKCYQGQGAAVEEELTMVAKLSMWRPRLATWKVEMSIRKTINLVF